MQSSCKLNLKNATSGTYKILGDSLREHPDFLFKKYSQATDIVLNKKGANVEVLPQIWLINLHFFQTILIIFLHINFSDSNGYSF